MRKSFSIFIKKKWKSYGSHKKKILALLPHAPCASEKRWTQASFPAFCG